jgi:hypothetical protein
MGNAGKVLTSANAPLIILNLLYRLHPAWSTTDLDEQTLYCFLLSNIFGGVVIVCSTFGEWAKAKLTSEEREIKGQLSELCLMLLSKLA